MLPRGSYITIADVDGTKPHRYLLGYDSDSGQLLWDEETDPDQRNSDGTPIVPGSLVSHTWDRFDGGMGHTVEDGKNGYYFGENWYVTPWAVKPRPTLTSVTLTGNSTPVEWMFEAEADDGTGFIYSLAGTKLYKVVRSTRVLWTTRDLASETTLPTFGRPDEWNDVWHFPCGQDVYFKRMTQVVDTLKGALLISGAQTETTFDLASTAHDGFLQKASSVNYAAARAATANAYTTNAWMQVGQAYGAGTYSIKRVYFQFDTSAIDDTVYNAKLRIYVANPPTASLTLQVRAYNWGASLTSADWRATPSGDTLVGSINSSTLTAGWNEIAISTTAISLTGTTYLYLLSSLDDDDPGTAPTGDESIWIEDVSCAGGHPAQLLVTHGAAATITDNTAAANASGGTAFSLLEDNTDDIFYFGCSTLFDGVFVNIVTPCDVALTLDWEIWTGAAWVDMVSAETDNTLGFTVSGWVTWDSTAQTGWAQTAVNGVTAYWVRVKTATAITTPPTADFTPPADVITATTLYADHFRAVGNKISRSNGRVIDACEESDTTVAGNWGGDYTFGRAGETITDLMAVGDELGICSDRNFYLFDGVGLARPMLGKDKPASTANGKGALQFYDWTLLPYTGLYRYMYGGTVPFGPDSIPGYASVNGISNEPIKLTHYGSDSCENIVYSFAKDAQSTAVYHLLIGTREEDALKLKWDTLYRSTTASKYPFVDSTRVLWFDYGNNLAYFTLSANGRPEGGTFGEANWLTVSNFDLGETNFGTDALKRLIKVEVETRNNVGVTLQFGTLVFRDASAFATLGSLFYTDGLSECFWTPGTNDTCRRLRVGLAWAAAGYTVSVTPPEAYRITAYAEIRPKQGEIIKVGIPLIEDNDGTVEGKWARLKAMASASTAKKVWDPDGNIIYATVVSAKRAMIAAQKGEPPQAGALLFLRRSNVA